MNIAEVRARFPQYSDMSDADLAAALHKKYYSDMPQAEFAAKIGVAQAPKAEDPGAGNAALIAGGHWLDSKAAGLREAVGSIPGVGPAIVRGLDSLDSAAGVKTPNASEYRSGDVDRRMQPLSEQHPWATGGSQFAADLVAKTPMGMATLGFLDPGTLQERGLRAGAGYAGGKVGELAGRGMARLAGPRAAGQSNQWGIPLTAGQASDSKPAKIVESVVANLPGGAGVISRARDETFGAFNRAVTRTFGDDAAKITPELLGDARTRVGGEIGKIASRNTWAMDKEFAQGFAGLTQEANEVLVGDALKKFNSWANIVAKKAGDGSMPGTQYRALRSGLGTAVKNSADGDTRRYLGLLKEQLETTMDRSISQADSGAWKQANRQYFNLNQVADATAQSPGELSLAKLLQSVNRSQRAAKFGAGNELADLAQWGKTTLPDTIPNSGTAQRLLYQRLISSPLTTIGAVGGGAYGADALGLGPMDAGAGLLGSYGVARALAGKPVSKATEELLKRLGGRLLGAGALEYAR